MRNSVTSCFSLLVLWSSPSDFHPFKRNLISTDLSHILTGQHHFQLFIPFPSYLVSNENCCRAALSITSVTKQAFDLKCRTGRGRDDPARFIWRLPFTLTFASLGTQHLPALPRMDPPGALLSQTTLFYLVLKPSCRISSALLKYRPLSPISSPSCLTAHCVY